MFQLANRLGPSHDALIVPLFYESMAWPAPELPFAK
jgi:hypothetical protein